MHLGNRYCWACDKRTEGQRIHWLPEHRPQPYPLTDRMKGKIKK